MAPGSVVAVYLFTVVTHMYEIYLFLQTLIAALVGDALGCSLYEDCLNGLFSGLCVDLRDRNCSETIVGVFL